MRKMLLHAGVLGAVLALGVPAITQAGTAPDPNLNDTVLGTVAGLRYATESSTYQVADRYAEATAGCGGPNWHLIGGGAAAGGDATNAWQAFDRPDDYTDVDTQPDDGFLAAGFGPAGKTFTTYSICMRNVALEYVSTSVANQPSGRRSGTAACSDPSWHVTTGSAAIATSNSWISTSVPTDGPDSDSTRDDGWRGTAFDTVNGLGGFSVSAICAQGVNLHYAKATAPRVSAGHVSSVKVSCGSAGHVVGGGVTVSGTADQSRVVVSAPFDGPDADHVPDDGWRVKVFAISGTDLAVTAFAICLQG